MTQLSDDEHKEVQRWQEANPWFNQNPSLTQAAIGIESHLAAHGVPLQDRLAHTSRSLARTFETPADQDARRAYQEIARVDPKLARRVTEDQYVYIAATSGRR